MSCSFNSSCSPHLVILLPTPLRKKLPDYQNSTIDMKKTLGKAKETNRKFKSMLQKMGTLNNFNGEILAD